MRIRAPAKINLRLRVVGKREDGYHLLDTVMVPVGLYDEIEIKRAKKGKKGLTVTCNHPLVPSGRENLAYKAAALLIEKKGIGAPVHIRIKKRIPVGAGLGGGSSDAAATLIGLDRLFRLKCPKREMLSLAASLGADVPFFIHGTPARARGSGELLSPLSSFPKLWLVILYPGFPVSTAWVFRHLDLKLTKDIGNTSINSLQGRPERIKRFLINELEGVTFQRYPRVAYLKERLLQEGAAGALMSGSGSSVFGIFSTGQAASKAFRRLRKEKGVRAYLVRSLS